MREVTKRYYIQETELCILLALKGVRTLYGICLDSDTAMTQEELYYNLFMMQKKGILNGKFQIEEELDCCVGRICTAARFQVLADVDELVPEKYFYVASEGAVMLEPVGQYDTGEQKGSFYLEAITEDEMWDRIWDNGFQTKTAGVPVPDQILEAARHYWKEDKNAILQHAIVGKLLQEYDIQTQCKTKQCIRFHCGLDTYLVCSDGSDVIEGGGERS